MVVQDEKARRPPGESGPAACESINMTLPPTPISQPLSTHLARNGAATKIVTPSESA